MRYFLAGLALGSLPVVLFLIRFVRVVLGTAPSARYRYRSAWPPSSSSPRPGWPRFTS